MPGTAPAERRNLSAYGAEPLGARVRARRARRGRGRRRFTPQPLGCQRRVALPPERGHKPQPTPASRTARHSLLQRSPDDCPPPRPRTTPARERAAARASQLHVFPLPGRQRGRSEAMRSGRRGGGLYAREAAGKSSSDRRPPEQRSRFPGHALPPSCRTGRSHMCAERLRWWAGSPIAPPRTRLFTLPRTAPPARCRRSDSSESSSCGASSRTIQEILAVNDLAWLEDRRLALVAALDRSASEMTADHGAGGARHYPSSAIRERVTRSASPQGRLLCHVDRNNSPGRCRCERRRRHAPSRWLRTCSGVVTGRPLGCSPDRVQRVRLPCEADPAVCRLPSWPATLRGADGAPSRLARRGRDQGDRRACGSRRPSIDGRERAARSTAADRRRPDRPPARRGRRVLRAGAAPPRPGRKSRRAHPIAPAQSGPTSATLVAECGGGVTAVHNQSRELVRRVRGCSPPGVRTARSESWTMTRSSPERLSSRRPDDARGAAREPQRARRATQDLRLHRVRLDRQLPIRRRGARGVSKASARRLHDRRPARVDDARARGGWCRACTSARSATISS